jgi:signal transduction histidine kinase
VVISLLNNTINYSPSGSTIEVDLVNTRDGISNSVKEEGPGIDPHEPEYVWQPFYRGDNEWTRSQSGSGLGLPLVRKIVDMHGSSVTLTSTQGTRTTVLIELPRSDDAMGIHELATPA